MKQNSIVLMALMTLCFAAATAQIVPTISSFAPTSGPVGTPVTISGTNFSSTPSNNIVFFGATKATVSASTTTQLTVTVPPGATYQPISLLTNGLSHIPSHLLS